MNDFTKDELEDLMICCSSGIYDDHPLENWKADLQKKIQNMMENYCEHTDCIEDHNYDVMRCKKCGALTL